jgi:hypothetical protein
MFDYCTIVMMRKERAFFESSLSAGQLPEYFGFMFFV